MSWRCLSLLSLCLSSGLSSPDTYVVVRIPSQGPPEVPVLHQEIPNIVNGDYSFTSNGKSAFLTIKSLPTCRGSLEDCPPAWSVSARVCNAMSGKVTLQKSKGGYTMTTGVIASTMMLCLQASKQALESRVGKLLSKIQWMEMNEKDTALTIKSPEDEITFTRGPPEVPQIHREIPKIVNGGYFFRSPSGINAHLTIKSLPTCRGRLEDCPPTWSVSARVCNRMWGRVTLQKSKGGYTMTTGPVM